MKGFTLVQAILLLEANGVEDITMIQYEDGSRYKFNYTVGHTKTQFADLTPMTEKEIIKANVIKSIVVKF
jgi:hypothetical protein